MGQAVYLEKLGQGQNQRKEAPPSEQTVYNVVANMLEAALQILQNPQAVAKLRQMFRGGQLAQNIQQGQPQQQQQKAGSYNNLNNYDVIANFIKEAVSSIDSGLGNMSVGGISSAPGISNRKQQTPYTGDFAVNTKNKGIRQKDIISFAKLNSPNFLPALKPPTESDLSPTKSRTEANANPMRNINPVNNQIANIIKTSLFKAAENPIERAQRARAYTARELGDILSAHPKPEEDGYRIYGNLYELRQRALEDINNMLAGRIPRHLPANQYEDIIKRIANHKNDIRKFLSRTEEGRALITISALVDIIRNNETTNPLYWMGVALLAYYHDRIHKSLTDQFGQEIANDIMSTLIYSRFFDKEQAGKEIDIPYLNIKLVLNPIQPGGKEPAILEPEKGYKRIGQFGNYSIVRKHDPNNPNMFDSPSKLLAKVLQDYENAWTHNPGFRDAIIRTPGFIGMRRLFGALRDRYEEARAGGENLPDLGRNLTHIAPSRNYEQLQRNFVQQFMYPMALSNVEKVVHLKDEGSTYIVFNQNGKRYAMRAHVNFYHVQPNPNAFGMPAVAMPGVMGPTPQQPQGQARGQVEPVVLVDIMPAGPIVELNDNLRAKLFPDNDAAKRNILDITNDVKTSPNARAVAMVSQQLLYMRNMMSIVSMWAPFNPYMMMYYQMLSHQYNMAKNMLENQYGQAIYVAPDMRNWQAIDPVEIDNRIRTGIRDRIREAAPVLGYNFAQLVGMQVAGSLGIKNVEDLLKDVQDYNGLKEKLKSALQGKQIANKPGDQFIEDLFNQALQQNNPYAQFVVASLVSLLPGRDNQLHPLVQALSNSGFYSQIGTRLINQYGEDFINIVINNRRTLDRNALNQMIGHAGTNMFGSFSQLHQEAIKNWQQAQNIMKGQLPGALLQDDKIKNTWLPFFKDFQIQLPPIQSNRSSSGTQSGQTGGAQSGQTNP